MKNVIYGLIVFTLILNACKPKPETKKITPPFENLNPAFNEFSLNADSAATLLLSSGTEIIIPEKAFISATGNVTQGNITLKYREFHDALDIYLSGIPMSFNSFGKQSDFETAGMFEIRAFKKDTTLKLAPGKTINIKFASKASGSDYNFFGMDENKQQWEFIDFVEPVPNPKRDSLQNLIAKQKLPLEIPIKESFVFNYDGILDVMIARGLSYKELKNANWLKKRAENYGLTLLNSYASSSVKYRGFWMPGGLMVWENKGERLPRWAKKEHDDGYYVASNLKKITNRKYHLTLSLERWNRETSSFDIKRKYTSTIETIMPIKALFAFKPETWKNNYQEAYAKVESYIESLKSEAQVFRNMEVSQLGIYNYDKLKKYDENAFFAQVEFTLDKNIDNELYTLDEVSCFTQDNKSVLKFKRPRWSQFTLIPNDTNFRMVTVLPENQIGYFSPEQYQAINFDSLKMMENPKISIELKVLEQPIASSADLQTLLGFEQ